MLCSNGCLITSTPDYEAPHVTPPLLLPASASPQVNIIPIIHPDDGGHRTYSASVLSEDGGQSVQIAIVLDFGGGTPDRPYQAGFQGTIVDPGTIEGGARDVGGLDVEDSSFVPLGCHTITMIASHRFDRQNGACPVCPSDKSTLTWWVDSCPNDDATCGTIDVSNCKALAGTLTNQCPDATPVDAGDCVPLFPVDGGLPAGGG